MNAHDHAELATQLRLMSSSLLNLAAALGPGDAGAAADHAQRAVERLRDQLDAVYLADGHGWPPPYIRDAEVAL